MEVHNTLGSGFLEKVYENALVVELRLRGLAVEQQDSTDVRYKGRVVGQYVADILVEGLVVLELKALDKLTGDHEAQVLNYLKATGLKVGLLINFGRPRLEWERLVL
jgi:GxxExxY protein